MSRYTGNNNIDVILMNQAPDSPINTVDCICFTNNGFEFDSKTDETGRKDGGDDVKKNDGATKEKRILPVKTKIYMYLSIFLSLWGDRMWFFGVGLFLIKLSPDSLQLTASFGFMSGGAVLFLGALVGDWVDNTPRLTAVRWSLIMQNITFCICASVVYFAFYYQAIITSMWENESLMMLVKAVIIITAVMSNITCISLRISLERDWVVELCEKDENLLASMNAAIRTINMIAKTLAPVLTGQIMFLTTAYNSALIIAVWNLVSAGAEYYFMRKVHEAVPALQTKTYKKKKDKGKDSQRIYVVGEHKDKQTTHPPIDDKRVAPVSRARKEKTSISLFKRMFGGLKIVFRGWKTYFKHDVALAGFCLACVYITVFYFDNITIGYAYSQGIPETVLGGLQGACAATGIIGSLFYPRIHKAIGVVRMGQLGNAAYLLCACFCVASVWAPGSPFNLMQSSLDTGCEGISCTNTLTVLPFEKNYTDGKYYVGESSTESTPNISICLLLGGMVTTRIGVWLIDLAITQLFLQSVKESERGIVSGVLSSLNTLMSMIKFLLVIALPKPHQYGLLILISYSFVVMAGISYAKYSYNSRVHVLPKCMTIRKCRGIKRSGDADQGYCS